MNALVSFSTINSNTYGLTPWVEIALKEASTVNTDDLKIEAEKYDFDILKIALKNQRRHKGIEELLAETKSIKELLPTEVFKLKCEEMNYDLEKNPEIWDAFNEVLQSVKKQ